jgi:hypothetical protein
VTLQHEDKEEFKGQMQWFTFVILANKLEEIFTNSFCEASIALTQISSLKKQERKTM